MSTDRLTEILNYLSAMSRDMGEFRQEVRDRLDKIEARLDAVEARLDGMETRLGGLEKRFDYFEMQVRSRFDDISADIRRLNHKFANVEEDTTELRIEQREQRGRIETLESKQA
jgi:chromosome segregation ATPase